MERKELENRMGKFVRDFRIYTETRGSVDYKVLRNGLRMFIQAELDRAREEGKLYALDNLKDYIFINDTHRNKDLPLTWDDLRHYIKEVEQIYSENLSKLTTK